MLNEKGKRANHEITTDKNRRSDSQFFGHFIFALGSPYDLSSLLRLVINQIKKKKNPEQWKTARKNPQGTYLSMIWSGFRYQDNSVIIEQKCKGGNDGGLAGCAGKCICYSLENSNTQADSIRVNLFV